MLFVALTIFVKCCYFTVFPRSVLLDATLSHFIPSPGEDYCPGPGFGVQVSKTSLTPYITCSHVTNYAR